VNLLKSLRAAAHRCAISRLWALRAWVLARELSSLICSSPSRCRVQSERPQEGADENLHPPVMHREYAQDVALCCPPLRTLPRGSLALRPSVLARELFSSRCSSNSAAMCRAYAHTVTVLCFYMAGGLCEVLALARIQDFTCLLRGPRTLLSLAHSATDSAGPRGEMEVNRDT